MRAGRRSRSLHGGRLATHSSRRLSVQVWRNSDSQDLMSSRSSALRDCAAGGRFAMLPPLQLRNDGPAFLPVYLRRTATTARASRRAGLLEFRHLFLDQLLEKGAMTVSGILAGGGAQ